MSKLIHAPTGVTITIEDGDLVVDVPAGVDVDWNDEQLDTTGDDDDDSSGGRFRVKDV